MKRFSAIFCIVIGLSTPTVAEAALWDWVPRFGFLPQAEKELHTQSASYACRFRNAWGNCVIYSFQPRPNQLSGATLPQE